MKPSSQKMSQTARTHSQFSVIVAIVSKVSLHSMSQKHSQFEVFCLNPGDVQLGQSLGDGGDGDDSSLMLGDGKYDELDI
jgi:hypothetical protein